MGRTVDMRKWQDGNKLVLAWWHVELSIVKGNIHTQDVGGDIILCQSHTFGASGRAARIWESSEVILDVELGRFEVVDACQSKLAF